MMPKLSRLIAVALVLLGGSFARGQGVEPASPASFSSQTGVLLLSNGQVISGRVSLVGDHYYVVLDNGEIRLRTTDVELFCRSLDEGYERKQAKLPAHDAVAHLDLADWCVKHALWGYAAKELAQAVAIDPRQPRIGLIERRLEIGRRQGAEEPVVAEATASGPSNDELDRLARTMPAGSIDFFANTIQPLLINHCTTAGCHGPSSTTKFSLMRTPLGRTPSRRLTQRNLYATMQQIDRAQPAESTLLNATIRPHGNSKVGILTGRDLVHYQQLAAWVQFVTGGSKTSPPPTAQAKSVEPRSGVLMQAAEQQAVASSLAVPRDPAQVAATAVSSTVAKSNEPTAPPPAEAPRSPNDYAPQDPFDPALFNRRFAPKKP